MLNVRLHTPTECQGHFHSSCDPEGLAVPQDTQMDVCFGVPVVFVVFDRRWEVQNR